MSHEYNTRHHDEKEEKQEKRGEREEKSWEEKWRRDPLNAAVWAIVIIWAGLVLLAANFGLYEDSFLEAWPLFFLGAGVILLLEILVRLVLPAYRQPFAGNFVLAVVFLALGLGGLISWNLLWAIALIAIGSYILIRGLFHLR